MPEEQEPEKKRAEADEANEGEGEGAEEITDEELNEAAGGAIRPERIEFKAERPEIRRDRDLR